MTADFRAWATHVAQLDRAVERLQQRAARLGVASPEAEGWLELLRWKLVPQVEAEPLLLAAVVGGTNIGKSLLFNHLAGETASGVSPLAAGTKHPVCLVPRGVDAPTTLARLFDGFQVRPWRSAEEPLEEAEEHLLFWRVGADCPPRLLLLDAPDIDSDARVNWRRARAIRQAADVLVAVLTQQKYNDAAVKQFFREAAEADKPTLVVFNQVDLQSDRAWWPQWLDTFSAETGTRPEAVYVVPRDRELADALRLPFFRVGRDGRGEPETPCSLRDDLAGLHFDAIKVRTLRGALAQVLEPGKGLPAYLRRVGEAAEQYAAAHRALSTTEMARVAWPSLPPGVLVDEIRAWWDSARSPWSRNIHGFYRTLGQGAAWPFRKLWEMANPEPADPLDTFRDREREAIVVAVEKMLDELERLAQVGNDTLRPRLRALLGGASRQRVLARVEEAHRTMPAVDDDYRAFLHVELNAWKTQSPSVVRFLRSLDHAVAIARPAISVLLVVSGWHVAGDLASQAAVHAAGHTVGQLAQEAAIAGGIAGGGEALVSGTSEGIGQAAGRLLLRLQTRYAQQRAAWLAAWLEKELLGDLLEDLHHGAETAAGDEWRDVEAARAKLASL